MINLFEFLIKNKIVNNYTDIVTEKNILKVIKDLIDNNILRCNRVTKTLPQPALTIMAGSINLRIWKTCVEFRNKKYYKEDNINNIIDYIIKYGLDKNKSIIIVLLLSNDNANSVGDAIIHLLKENNLYNNVTIRNCGYKNSRQYVFNKEEDVKKFLNTLYKLNEELI